LVEEVYACAVLVDLLFARLTRLCPRRSAAQSRAPSPTRRRDHRNRLPIEARNAETALSFQAASTATGNYTLSQTADRHLRAFSDLARLQKIRRQNIALGVAKPSASTSGLEVGATTDSITVTEAVPLLKNRKRRVGATCRVADPEPTARALDRRGAGHRRNPNPSAVTQLLPGTSYQATL